MIINLKTSKVSLADVRGSASSLPPACVFNFISAIKKNGHDIEPDRLTPKARSWVKNLVATCKSGSVGDVCGFIYEGELN